MFYINLKKKLNRRLKFKELQNNNKKLYPFYKSLIKDKINIFDIGAGQRMLPEIINFNGISKVFLVDPNDNLQYSYDQLIRYFSDIKNIFTYKYGISDKTKKLKYFKSHKSTISTFAFNDKKLKINKKYYSAKNEYKKVYSFADFLKKFKLPKPDIIKIDVEGLEAQVISSVLKISNPLIVQIETNMNNSMLHQSFSKINNLLINENYFLHTLFPSYGDPDSTKISNINLKDIELNFIKSHIVQSECYYIKKKQKYTIKDLVCFYAYGFHEYFKKNLNKSVNKFSKSEKKILKNLENIND
jgi:FkbM family methyltransferase